MLEISSWPQKPSFTNVELQGEEFTSWICVGKIQLLLNKSFPYELVEHEDGFLLKRLLFVTSQQNWWLEFPSGIRFLSQKPFCTKRWL